MSQLIQSNWNFITLLYFVVYLTNKLWMNFQVGSPTCFGIFCHKCDWLRYIENAIEFNTNHLFDHQIVMPFFCNFPQLFALVCGWKLYWKKYMSPTKIFCCRLSKQFVNQITLLCDGKCHCNAAKTILRQLIVVGHLKVARFIWLPQSGFCNILHTCSDIYHHITIQITY